MSVYMYVYVVGRRMKVANSLNQVKVLSFVFGLKLGDISTLVKVHFPWSIIYPPPLTRSDAG